MTWLDELSAEERKQLDIDCAIKLKEIQISKSIEAAQIQKETDEYIKNGYVYNTRMGVWLSPKQARVKKHRHINSEFNRKVKDMVLDRDDYKCVECGSTDRLTVHHIIEKSKGGENTSNNLITLCYKCHCKKHKGEPVYNLMIKSLEAE